MDKNVDPEYVKLSACGHVAHSACYLEWLFNHFLLSILIFIGLAMKDRHIVQSAIKNWNQIVKFVMKKWLMANGMSIVIAK